MHRHVRQLSLCAIAALAGAEDAAQPMPTPSAVPAPVAQTLPAAYSAGEREACQRRADELGLDRHAYWRTLLHTTGSRSGSSRVDDPAFFLAPGGKHDPRAELHADLEAFFAALPAVGEHTTAGDRAAVIEKSAANRFPARLEWLCAQLGIDRTRLPLTGSSEFEQVYRQLGPRGAAMVFPTAYMNSPASMFGHTLLMIRSRFRSTLLSQSVNYAAVTTESNGLIFAMRGIFGLYPGYYSLMPYYQKVQEYTDLDQRDIWEYDLAFTADDMRRMLLHTWEMRGIYSDYFFFDENCSFNLLYLIDAGRPDMNLHEQTSWWVIPLDTIKLLRRSGLITGATYRPSRTTRVRHLASLLEEDQAALARQIALGKQSAGTATDAAVGGTADPATRARILDLAGEYLQSLRGRKKVAQADFQSRLLPILNARSAIALPAGAADAEVPAPAPPDAGHPSARLSLGGGREGGIGFGELAFRPAYHDLTDPLAGYLPGSQIEFANLSLRWYDGDHHPQLDRFDVISLRSFSMFDSFYQPIAWKVDTGVLRQEMGQEGEWHHQAFLSGGFGLCHRFTGLGMVYALIDEDARVGGRDPNHAIGVGASAGVLSPIGDSFFIGPYASAMRYVLGDRATNWQFGATVRVSLTRELGLSVDLSRSSSWGLDQNAFAVRGLWYF